MPSAKLFLKNNLYRFLPLSFRKSIAIWLKNQQWLDEKDRNWWAVQLVKDLSRINLEQYHQFLWQNHLAYAESYNVEDRFGDDKIEKSRKKFFSDMLSHLKEVGIDTSKDVNSVFEVGCSLGYQLYYLEKNFLPNAEELIGIDLDSYAIHSGIEYLKKVNSKIHLKVADMVDIDVHLAGKMYDIIFCTGTLLYVNQNAATRIVRIMLEHINHILCIAALADPKIDNSQLKNSSMRESDETFVHNIDEMILEAGGKIVSREWHGDKLVDGLSVYFLFATKN